jgi:hypothetical protein
MSITVDEFLRLKEICEPKRRLDLEAPLTNELIDEASQHLPAYLIFRLEMVKNVDRGEWPKFEFLRKDGLGNIKPHCVRNAVCNVFWRLARTVETIARKRVFSFPGPMLVRPSADGTVQCPGCGKVLVLSSGCEDGGSSPL